jgi:hypothetical protein
MRAKEGNQTKYALLILVVVATLVLGVVSTAHADDPPPIHDCLMWDADTGSFMWELCPTAPSGESAYEWSRW